MNVVKGHIVSVDFLKEVFLKFVNILVWFFAIRLLIWRSLPFLIEQQKYKCHEKFEWRLVSKWDFIFFTSKAEYKTFPLIQFSQIGLISSRKSQS